jgi:hypothetical protein
MLRITGVVILALVAGLAAFVQIQQHILRWRAERLLADMRELQSHKSTWADAQKIMTRWDEWGSYEGSCTQEECSYSIELVDTLSTLVWAHVEHYPILRSLFWPLTILGEKNAFVEVSLDIKSGIVVKSSFQLFVGDLLTTAKAVNDFRPHEFRAERLLHPEYWIGRNGGCTGCIKFETVFTPLAGREKIRELTDFDFSCITRLLPCTTVAEVLPTAWKQNQDESARISDQYDAIGNCKVPLEFYGSQNYSIAVADVISSRGPVATGDNTDWSRGLRIIRSLKGQLPWPQNRTLTASQSNSGEEIYGWGSTDMVAGKRYILFGELQKEQSGKQVLVLDNCGVVPYNEQNLSAIQRGIDTSLARHIPDR